MINWVNKNYALAVAVIGVALILLSLIFDIDGPDDGLTEWTAWAAKYVALVVAAQKVWKVSDVAINGSAKRLGL